METGDLQLKRLAANEAFYFKTLLFVPYPNSWARPFKCFSLLIHINIYINYFWHVRLYGRAFSCRVSLRICRYRSMVVTRHRCALGLSFYSIKKLDACLTKTSIQTPLMLHAEVLWDGLNSVISGTQPLSQWLARLLLPASNGVCRRMQMGHGGGHCSYRCLRILYGTGYRNSRVVLYVYGVLLSLVNRVYSLRTEPTRYGATVASGAHHYQNVSTICNGLILFMDSKK
jgi:hypothetical protein